MRKIILGLAAAALLSLQAVPGLTAESPDTVVEATTAIGQQSHAAAPGCLPSSAPPEVQMSYLDGPAGEVIGVLCCCSTFSGTCCNYQTFCGGFISGCFCQ